MKLKLCICILILSGFFSSAKAVEGPVFLKRACAPSFNIDSTVTFYWDKPSDTCSSFTGYYLYGRESSANAYALLDSVKNFNAQQYSFKLPNTKLTWQFFWSVKNSCGGNDTFNSFVLSIDKDPPSITVLDSVSVDLLSQKTVMGWQPNLSPDLWGYTLYRRTDTTQGFTEILDLKGLSYEFTGSNPAVDVTYLAIASMDSCDNLGPISWQHRTIQLKHKIDTCKKEIYLSWTPYIGWQTLQYVVWADTTETGAYVPLAVLPFNKFQYTYNYISGKTFKFFVRSHKQGSNFTSSSNLLSQFTRKIITPKFNYISKVTVRNNKDILVSFRVDTEAEIAYFNILKSEDSSNFQIIATIINDPVLPVQDYFDTDVDVQNKKYFYRIEAYNSCKKFLIGSDVSHNILLKLDPSASIYKLYWSDYNYWPTGIEYFSVRRGENPGSGYFWSQIFLTDASNGFSYTDDNSPLNGSGFAICYEIVAHENPGNQFGTQDSSTSNQVCAVLDATVIFPNAFVPSGVNSHFMPVGRFINWNRSIVEIYNRWGELVWQSNGIDYAWDGNDMNENPCIPGIYYYKAKIIGLRGNVINKSGSVNLIR